MPPDASLFIRRLSLAEVAEREGVSTDTVMRWITSGELAAINASSSRASKKPRYRVHPRDLEAFEASRAVGVAPARPSRRVSLQNVRQFF